MTSSFINNFNNDLPAPQRKPRVQKYTGGTNSRAVIEARCQRLYSRQLEGKTTRQLVIEHSQRENISETTGWADWNKVKEWNDQDWLKERDKMIPRLQAMRMRLFNKAISKGQLQTAAQILDSLGKVVGESVETVNIQAPELAIRIEPKQ